MFIVEKNGRYWVEGEGWSTTDPMQATRYTERDAFQWAHALHAEVYETSAGVHQ